MNFSASELVKRSASQLLFIYLKKIKYKPSKGQIEGDKYAKEIIKKEKASDEKRGIISIDKNNLLFFCIDMVKSNNIFVELKKVDNQEDYPEWYLESSIIQSAFYASLLKDVKHLDTPLFKKKEGFKQEIIKLPKDINFELWFGKDKYIIYPNDKLKKHYIKKAKLIANALEIADFDSCREFDKKYKFKEFNIFKPNYLKK